MAWAASTEPVRPNASEPVSAVRAIPPWMIPRAMPAAALAASGALLTDAMAERPRTRKRGRFERVSRHPAHLGARADLSPGAPDAREADDGRHIAAEVRVAARVEQGASIRPEHGKAGPTRLDTEPVQDLHAEVRGGDRAEDAEVRSPAEGQRNRRDALLVRAQRDSEIGGDEGAAMCPGEEECVPRQRPVPPLVGMRRREVIGARGPRPENRKDPGRSCDRCVFGEQGHGRKAVQRTRPSRRRPRRRRARDRFDALWRAAPSSSRLSRTDLEADRF